MTTKRSLATRLTLSAGILAAIAAMPAAHAEVGAPQTLMITNGPQLDPDDRSGASLAQANVRDSHRYEGLVRTNPRFRANRMNKECGPIGDRGLYSECVASFGR